MILYLVFCRPKKRQIGWHSVNIPEAFISKKEAIRAIKKPEHKKTQRLHGVEYYVKKFKAV